MAYEVVGGAGGVVLVLGVAVLRYGADEFRLLYHVFTTDPVSASAVPTVDGLVAAEGRATATDDQTFVEAPFTGTDCLAYAYEYHEYQQSGLTTSGCDHEPFLLEDDAGAVRVDPDGSDFALENDFTTRETGDMDDSLPEDFEDTISPATQRLFGKDTPPDGVIWRFSERRIEPGDHCYVLGTVEEGGPSQWESHRISTTVEDGEANPTMVISDLSGFGVVRARRVRAVLLAVVGAVLTVGGLTGVAVWALPALGVA